MIRFAKWRTGEGFVIIVEVRVAVIQSATKSCRAFNVLIEFRQNCSQISFVKIPQLQ